jgi:hypothetical protein
MRNGVVCASTIKMTDNCEIYKIFLVIFTLQNHTTGTELVGLVHGTLVSGLRDAFTVTGGKL